MTIKTLHHSEIEFETETARIKFFPTSNRESNRVQRRPKRRNGESNPERCMRVVWEVVDWKVEIVRGSKKSLAPTGDHGPSR